MRNYNNLPQEVITLVAGRAGQERDSPNRLYEIPFGIIGKRKAMASFPHRLCGRMNHDDSIYVKLQRSIYPIQPHRSAAENGVP